jgi:hypothetical protein
MFLKQTQGHHGDTEETANGNSGICRLETKICWRRTKSMLRSLLCHVAGAARMIATIGPKEQDDGGQAQAVSNTERVYLHRGAV